MDLTAKEFELLLCQFCQQDLPGTFTVEHDVKDIGLESENRRQIDMKISGKLGVSNILICGEAKNWSEKVGIETIDGLVGKYLAGEIKANKVICFSAQGFTAPAITRAKRLGIELLEPATAGNPIHKIPYVVAIGTLGQLNISVSHKSPQKNLMAINVEDYIILKGSERISFLQNLYRQVTGILKSNPEINVNTDLSRIPVLDENVLYELRQKEGYLYNANFDITANIDWQYLYEFLPLGVIRHVNSNQIRHVNLQGDLANTLSNVLLSPTKAHYATKTELIEGLVEQWPINKYHILLIDPDSLKDNPENPKVQFIK